MSLIAQSGRLRIRSLWLRHIGQTRPGAHAYGISFSLADSPEEGPHLSGAGHNLAPLPRPLEPPCLDGTKWNSEAFHLQR